MKEANTYKFNLFASFKGIEIITTSISFSKSFQLKKHFKIQMLKGIIYKTLVVKYFESLVYKCFKTIKQQCIPHNKCTIRLMQKSVKFW